MLIDSDSTLCSITQMNLMVQRYPEAISFAFGAPHPVFLQDINIDAYINRFTEYLCIKQQLSLRQVQGRLYQYCSPKGLINDLVAQALNQDEGMEISANSVMITVGAQEAILLVLRRLFDSTQDKLAVVTPSYIGMLGTARLLNINMIGINETYEGIDLQDLAEKCQYAHQINQPIRALYLAPDFSNPSGTRMPLEKRQHLLELANHYNFFIIEDNTYRFTELPGQEIPMLKTLDSADRVILIGTFSKICFPGPRVGYLVVGRQSQRFMDDLVIIKSMISINTSPICQAIIGGMLLAHAVSIKKMAEEKSVFYRQNTIFLLEALQREFSGKKINVSWNHPEGGFFACLRTPFQVDQTLLEVSASKFGVLWAPMTPFYLDDKVQNELRLSASSLTSEQIKEGVNRLSNFLHYLPEHIKDKVKEENFSE